MPIGIATDAWTLVEHESITAESRAPTTTLTQQPSQVLWAQQVYGHPVWLMMSDACCSSMMNMLLSCILDYPSNTFNLDMRLQAYTVGG